MRIFFPLLASLLFITTCDAAEIAPRLVNQRIVISLTGLTIPELYQKGFKSGLENTVLIRLTSTHGTQHSRANAVATVKYDLWDEVFRVDVIIDGAISMQKNVTQLDGVLQTLASIELGDPLHLSELSSDESFQIEAEVLINPVDREKMERLKIWVAANSAPRLPGALISSNGALAPKPNDLFNKIFAQYLEGKDLAAPWSITIKSAMFTRHQLLQGASPP